MEIYNGIIKEKFIKAEITFNLDLPEFCEDQEFELYELIDDNDHQIADFALLFNSESAIVKSVNSAVVYTGPIDPSEIETETIAQLEIEKNEVDSFPLRKFKLKVL